MTAEHGKSPEKRSHLKRNIVLGTAAAAGAFGVYKLATRRHSPATTGSETSMANVEAGGINVSLLDRGSKVQRGSQTELSSSYDPLDVFGEDGNFDREKQDRARQLAEAGVKPVWGLDPRFVGGDEFIIGATSTGFEASESVEVKRGRKRKILTASIALGGIGLVAASILMNQGDEAAVPASNPATETPYATTVLETAFPAVPAIPSVPQAPIRPETPIAPEAPKITPKTSVDLTDAQAFKEIDRADGSVDGKLTITIKSGSNFDNDLGETLNNIGVGHYDLSDATINGGPRWVDTLEASGRNASLYGLVYAGDKINIDPQVLVVRFKELNVTLSEDTLNQLGLVSLEHTTSPVNEAGDISKAADSVTEQSGKQAEVTAPGADSSAEKATASTLSVSEASALKLNTEGKFNIDDLSGSQATLQNGVTVNLDLEVTSEAEKIRDGNNIAAIIVAKKPAGFSYLLTNLGDKSQRFLAYDRNEQAFKFAIMAAAEEQKKKDEEDKNKFLAFIQFLTDQGDKIRGMDDVYKYTSYGIFDGAFLSLVALKVLSDMGFDRESWRFRRVRSESAKQAAVRPHDVKLGRELKSE